MIQDANFFYPSNDKDNQEQDFFVTSFISEAARPRTYGDGDVYFCKMTDPE